MESPKHHLQCHEVFYSLVEIAASLRSIENFFFHRYNNGRSIILMAMPYDQGVKGLNLGQGSNVNQKYNFESEHNARNESEFPTSVHNVDIFVDNY